MSQNIRVKAPDGTIVEFPSGTDDATIVKVMGENYGAGKPSAASRAVSAVTGAVRGNASESAGGGLLSDEYLDNLHASPQWKEGSFLDRLGIAIKNANAQLFGGGDADVQRRI